VAGMTPRLSRPLGTKHVCLLANTTWLVL
jgi:hypothetical protein